MRNIFVIGMLFFYIGLTAQCLAEERKETQADPSAPSVPKRPQSAQPSKPILPPTVLSSPSAAVSPTPSPNISAPVVTPQVISTSMYTSSANPQVHLPPQLPSIPVRGAAPVVPNIPKLQNIPVLFKTVIGRIVKTGLDEDGTLWMELEDKLVDRRIKIKIQDSNNISILKQDKAISVKDLDINDLVKINYTRHGSENIANLIRIMTEEELKNLMNAGSERPKNTEDITVEK